MLALAIEHLLRLASRRFPQLDGVPGLVAGALIAVLVLAMGVLSPGSRVNQSYFETEWQTSGLLSALMSASSSNACPRSCPRAR